MRRVATCYAKTCDQSDPVRGETKMHYRVIRLFTHSIQRLFSARNYRMAPALLFVGFNFAEPHFFPFNVIGPVCFLF